MMTIDLGQLAREVELPVEQVQAVVELLDAGNTVPFVARFRKDQIGGLFEDQVRRIQTGVLAQRSLAERKEAVLRVIESQGKLSSELKEKIEQTHSLRRLEDIFLPYKPKKQTLGSLAKDRGLEPLSREILHASPAAANLDARAADFVNPDRELTNAAEVLLGVGHLLAEHFSEHAEARTQLRRTFWRTARMICKPGEAVEELKDLDRQAQIEQEALRKAIEAQRKAEAAQAPLAPQSPESEIEKAALDQAGAEEAPQAPPGEASRTMEADAPSAQVVDAADPTGMAPVVAPAGHAPVEGGALEAAPAPEEASTPEADVAGQAEPLAPMSPEAEIEKAALDQAGAEEAPQAPPGEGGRTMEADAPGAQVVDVVAPIGAAPVAAPSGHAPGAGKAPAKAIAQQTLARKKAKDQVKRRKRQKAVQTFRDFFDLREPIKNLTPQRVLSINRGERVRALEVMIEADVHAMQKQAEEVLVPADHPHGDFLRACAHDAVARLIIPSLVQEARRELNDEAEAYAIKIYAENLTDLLLQKPIRGRRILAIEPGYRKGCKIAAVDEAGRVLGVGMLQVVGREDWRKKGRERLVEIIQKHHVTIVAIGDGPGSREVERMVTDVLEHDLKDAGVEYTVVPEAGAAAYGTSPLAREELSKYDPSHRIAISIARRLLDPLAELVKVSAANIEVGPAHYDIKTKLLRDTLDSVVESVVSHVGVDVNRANPALLRYVSGMNQLTARRVYEFREHYGPLRNREQLKDIPGIDEKTYRQAAGFMKVTGGENPLDGTWIHPEAYDAANKVLDALGLAMQNVAPPPPKPKAFAEEVLAEPVGETSSLPSTETESSGQDSVPPDAAVSQEPGEIATAEQPPVEAAPPSDAASASEAEASTPPNGDAVSVAASGELPDVGEAVTSEAVTSEAATSEAATSEPAPEAATSEPAPVAARATEAATSTEPLHTSAAPVPPPAEIPYNEEVERRSADWDLDQKAQELGVGKRLLQYILAELARPGRDPREAFSSPPLRSHRMSLDDVQPGMELKGIVVSVVDFGAFVDIGLSESGLVHISRLANRFVRDAHDEVAVGDVIQVWVVDIDKNRGRVSLTAIEPGAERPREDRRDRPKKDQKRERPAGQGQPSGERRPRQQQRRDQGKKGGRTPRQPAVYVVQSKKPAKPISKKMIEGKEPLRSFSDLQQFFEKKREDDEEEPKS